MAGLTLFAVNRSLDEPMPIEIVASGFGSYDCARHNNFTMQISMR